MNCMACTYCHDSCCQYGADIDADNVPRVERYADELERFTGVPRDRWWRTRLEAGAEGPAAVDWTEDREFPGGRQTRTRVEGGACVFLARTRAGACCTRSRSAVGSTTTRSSRWSAPCSRSPSTAGCFIRRTRSPIGRSSASTTARRSTGGCGARSTGTSAPASCSSSTRLETGAGCGTGRAKVGSAPPSSFPRGAPSTHGPRYR